MSSFVNETGCKWEFNPPHASHFGGTWERKIGQIKRILDVTLAKSESRLISFDELSTLMQEAVAIVNYTPLYEISTDPNAPSPINPYMLLTLRGDSGMRGIVTDDSDLSSYDRKHWIKIQHLVNCFWTEWQKNYLQNLQVRQKWLKATQQISVRDLAFVRLRIVQGILGPLHVSNVLSLVLITLYVQLNLNYVRVLPKLFKLVIWKDRFSKSFRFSRNE